MARVDEWKAAQRRFPALRGDLVQRACRAGNGAGYLYDALWIEGRTRRPFEAVRADLAELAARIAARLAATPCSTYPHPREYEIVEALSLVYPHPPVAAFGAETPGAGFWNWWTWLETGAGAAPADKVISDLTLAERLSAAATALSFQRGAALS